MFNSRYRSSIPLIFFFQKSSVKLCAGIKVRIVNESSNPEVILLLKTDCVLGLRVLMITQLIGKPAFSASLRFVIVDVIASPRVYKDK
jgi:hypothetical protein